MTLFESEMVATTMAFLTLGMTQLFHAFNIRSGRQSFVVGIFKNKWMPMAFVLSVALQIFVVLIPGLNGFFKVAQLSGMQWLYVMVASFAIVPICEIVKFIKSIIRKLEKESK